MTARQGQPALGVLLALALVAASGLGCLRDDRVTRSRSGVFGSSAPVVQGPEKNRCQQHGASGARGSCDDAKYLAEIFVRKLSVGDEVCIEGGFGESPGAACQARAAVVDVGQNSVLLEVREAQPGSRWHDHVMGQVWYEEGALVDLYLAERGY